MFHGPSGSGKHHILKNFIDRLYGFDKEVVKQNVMFVNCSHGKGIKFIRDELKFFAKMSHQQITMANSNTSSFKSIVLFNADQLTTDAQSALRRCIEVFSHNTRFFLVVDDKSKLLCPILSRFCLIHVPTTVYKGKNINLHQFFLEQTFQMKRFYVTRREWLVRKLNAWLFPSSSLPSSSSSSLPSSLEEEEIPSIATPSSHHSIEDCIDLAELLYNKGYSCNDVIKYIQNDFMPFSTKYNPEMEMKKYEILIFLEKIKRIIRKEQMLMTIAFKQLLGLG